MIMNNSPITVSGNLLNPYGAQNKDIDAISQTSLTGVRLRLRHRLSYAYKDGAYRECGIYQCSSRTYPMGNPICCKMPVAGGSGMWDFFASSSSFCSAAPSSASPSILSATPRYMLTAFAISFRSIFGYTDTCGAGGGGRGMELCFSLNLLTVPVARSLGRNISLITLLLRSRGMETSHYPILQNILCFLPNLDKNVIFKCPWENCYFKTMTKFRERTERIMRNRKSIDIPTNSL